MEKITVKASLKAPVNKAWEYYTRPAHITQWNFADPSWHCPHATNDLKVGGKYLARMEARDGSFGFDFEATYIEIGLGKNLVYVLDDGRQVSITFDDTGNRTEITIVFDPESENPVAMQQAGWQAILDNFAAYVEKCIPGCA